MTALTNRKQNKLNPVYLRRKLSAYEELFSTLERLIDSPDSIDYKKIDLGKMQYINTDTRDAYYELMDGIEKHKYTEVVKSGLVLKR